VPWREAIKLKRKPINNNNKDNNKGNNLCCEVIFLGHVFAKLLMKKTLLAINYRQKKTGSVCSRHQRAVNRIRNWLTYHYGEFDCPDLLAML